MTGACDDSVDPAASGAVDSSDSVPAGGMAEPSVEPVSGTEAGSVVGATSSAPAVTEADSGVVESSDADVVAEVSVDEAVVDALADDDDPSDSETDSEGSEDSVVPAGATDGDTSSSDVLVSSSGVATVTTGSPLDSVSVSVSVPVPVPVPVPDPDPDPSNSPAESVVSGAEVEDGLEGVLESVSSTSVEGAPPEVVPVDGPLNSMVGLAVPGGCVWISMSMSSGSVADGDSSVEGDSVLLGPADASDPASGASVGSTDT